MVETERAPLKAEGAEGGLLMPDSKACLWEEGGGGSRRSLGWRKWICGSAWAVLAESDHPVTGGAVFCVIFCQGDGNIRPCAWGKGLNSGAA